MAALVLVTVVLSLGVVARRAIALDGFATADFLVRNSDRASRVELVIRTRQAQVRLVLLLVAGAAVAGAAGGWLALRDSPTARLVALLGGLALVLRSRLFTPGWVGVPLLLAGLGVAGTAATRLVLAAPTGRWWWPSLVGGVLAGLVLAAQQARTPHPTTAGRRVLHWLEATAVTTMVCATAAFLTA